MGYLACLLKDRCIRIVNDNKLDNETGRIGLQWSVGRFWRSRQVGDFIDVGLQIGDIPKTAVASAPILYLDQLGRIEELTSSSVDCGAPP